MTKYFRFMWIKVYVRPSWDQNSVYPAIVNVDYSMTNSLKFVECFWYWSIYLWLSFSRIGYVASNYLWMINWKWFWRNWSWPSCRHCSCIYLEGLRKTTKVLGLDSRPSGRDIISGPPEYETGCYLLNHDFPLGFWDQSCGEQTWLLICIQFKGFRAKNP
jgi:hypothetical protein